MLTADLQIFLDTEDSLANVLTNLFNVATGSGAHEKAMREYLNPFKGGQNYNISQGPVADYMSGYLKDYVDPANQAGGTWKDGRMSITGLGPSPNPFSKEGLAVAANLSSDPSFQAENLFGEGTLTKTDSGYDYTGGKFDFNLGSGGLDWFEKNIFRPSEYTMSFDKDFRPFNPQTRFKQQQLMNKKKQDMQQRIREAEAKAAADAKAKADAAAAAAKKQYSGQGAQGGGGGTNIGGGQQTSSGIAGGAISHSAARAARGNMSGWGLADGGLINFYRYGGFV